jgi:hypothetical protein
MESPYPFVFGILLEIMKRIDDLLMEGLMSFFSASQSETLLLFEIADLSGIQKLGDSVQTLLSSSSDARMTFDTCTEMNSFSVFVGKDRHFIGEFIMPNMTFQTHTLLTFPRIFR